MLSKGIGKVGGDAMARELELDSGWYSKRITGGVGGFSTGKVGAGGNCGMARERESWLIDSTSK